MVLLGRIELPTSSLPKQGKHRVKVRLSAGFEPLRLCFAKDPHQTQTVRSCSLRVFLLKVLWSNRIAKSDLRRTYTAGNGRTLFIGVTFQIFGDEQCSTSVIYRYILTALMTSMFDVNSEELMG